MFSIQRGPFGFSVLAPLCFAIGVFGTAGCVDKEKCEESVRVTRDALAKEQPDIARQWRERAWKICNDAAMTATLDKEIVDKEAELAKRAADAVKAVGESAQQRLNTATAVWKAYDKLSEKDHNAERLEAHRQTAARMSQGLPPEYAAQIDTYNSGEFEKRGATLKPAGK
jgi:hypothetical protein